MVDSELLQKVKDSIRYPDGKRKITCCYCGEECNRSIIPHLKEKHPDKWEEWCQDFVHLYNQGYSLKGIWKQYKEVITWVVIEKEIRRVDEEGSVKLKIREKDKIKSWEPSSEDFQLQTTTVWSFPLRGDWAVHQSDYRGNWAPEIPRNLILQYSDKGDVILDPFVGGGTTLIECLLLGRNGIGVDITPYAVTMTEERLCEMEEKSAKTLVDLPDVDVDVILGDARHLSTVSDASVDLVCAHPPYGNSLRYTTKIEGDLSHIHDIEEFCDEIEKAANELYRVLKPNKHCAVLIGDIRRNKRMIPLGFFVMERFRKVGFDVEEIIIKKQHNDKSSIFYNNNFLKYQIAHEYLFIFVKDAK